MSPFSIQDKSFLSMLGDIRYNEWGQVVGAGAVEVRYFLPTSTSKIVQASQILS